MNKTAPSKQTKVLSFTKPGGATSLAPDVGGIPLLLFHLLDVGVGLLGIHLPELLANFYDEVPHVLGHHLGVAADVKVSSLVPDQLPESLGVLAHSVGDVDFLGAVPREGGVKRQDPVFDELLQFLAVEVVHILMSEKEHSVKNILAIKKL